MATFPPYQDSVLPFEVEPEENRWHTKGVICPSACEHIAEPNADPPGPCHEERQESEASVSATVSPTEPAAQTERSFLFDLSNGGH